MNRRADVTDRILSTPAETGHAALDAKLEEFNRISRQWNEAHGEARSLRQSRQGAEHQDAKALADAIRAGEPDPGPAHTLAADKALAEANRKAAALDLLLAEVTGELRQAHAMLGRIVVKNRLRNLDAIGEQIVEAANELAELVSKFQSEAGIIGWATATPMPRTTPTHVVRMWDLRGQDGDPLLALTSLDAVPAAVAEFLEKFASEHRGDAEKAQDAA